MNDKNAFSTLLTVLITAVAVGVSVGVITYTSAASKKNLEIEDLKEQLSQQQAIPFTAADEIKDWKTYINDKYGFSFKYPVEWKNIENTDSEIAFSNDNEDYHLSIFTPLFEGGFEEENPININKSIDGRLYEGWKSNYQNRIKDNPLFSQQRNRLFIYFDDKKMSILFDYNQLKVDGEQIFDQILSTFQFTK